jgi:hypothetical protein
MTRKHLQTNARFTLKQSKRAEPEQKHPDTTPARDAVAQNGSYVRAEFQLTW